MPLQDNDDTIVNDKMTGDVKLQVTVLVKTPKTKQNRGDIASSKTISDHTNTIRANTNTKTHMALT